MAKQDQVQDQVYKTTYRCWLADNDHPRQAAKQQTAVYNDRSRERGLKNMNEFLKAFPILHGVRAELRLLEKGQPVRGQLPTVEKLSALRSELSWTHYK